MKSIFDLKIREKDDFGKGHFGASRGLRKHNGVDLLIAPNEIISSPIDGVITKFGYPYRGNFKYRYIEITHKSGFRVRIHYAKLDQAHIGLDIHKGNPIAIAQDIAGHYSKAKKKMLNHIHVEVWNEKGVRVDPTSWLALG